MNGNKYYKMPENDKNEELSNKVDLTYDDKSQLRMLLLKKIAD